jgi:bromodomain-containing factor 1
MSSQHEPETPSQPQDRPLPNGSAPPIYVPGSFHPPHREPFGPTSPITGQQCRSLLAIIRQIKKAREAGPFNTPVDPVAFNIPHYTNIIKKPMDLSTVETKLNASNPSPPKDKSRPVKKDTSLGTYSNVQEVVEDVRQIWNNTRIFNGPHHAVSLNANKLDDMFETAIQKAKLGEEISGTYCEMHMT